MSKTIEEGQNAYENQKSLDSPEVGLIQKMKAEKEIIHKIEKENLFISSFSNDFSLQNKFKEFRKQRQDKFKNKQYLKNKKILDRSTKGFQDLLRNKFVEIAKKYLGVPYAQRYFKSEDPLYHSPLFLDCCALVRQVVYDLREDFGFSLGRWNQAYQYDTLPIDIKLEDMKPGDLVFYSGTYYDSKKRKQRHDMVHVEIFLGGLTGEQTIGARWNNGVVSIFDSYQFVSKAYYDMKFHYKSIDTWLQGICKSFCNIHLWESETSVLITDKFSVFADSGEENADDNGNDFEEEKVEHKEKNEGVSVQTKIQLRKVFVGKGNNERMIKSYFSNEKYVLLDPKMAFSNKYDIKWVQLLHEIDFLSFKENSQIVNHISNIKIIASKNGLIQTFRDFEANNPNFKGLIMDEFMPATFRLDILSDEVLFMNCHNEGLWITKPYNANKGINLKIVKNITKFKEDFLKTKRFNLGKYSTNELFGHKGNDNNEALLTEENLRDVEIVRRKVIIQKYIHNPLLLNKKKFDIRCYMLIASTKPLFVLFHHGYCRLCLNDYSLDVNQNDELDKLAHITNNAVQKKHPDYFTLKETSIWSMNDFQTYLQENLHIEMCQIENLYHEIKKILAHTIRCAEFKLDKKLGYFELLGCDILIDDQLKPYLLELNSNPAISTNIEVHKQIIPELITKSLDLVLSLNENTEKIKEIIKEENIDLAKFEVLFNQEKNFIYE